MTRPEFDFCIDDPDFHRFLKQHAEKPLKDLDRHQGELIQEWSKLYLETFGRDSFFSSQRVERLFHDLTPLILKSLLDTELNRYLTVLKRAGKMFFDLGVPFEEVILCIHLFQEACLRLIQKSGDSDSQSLQALRNAFEELGRLGTAMFAVSYFRAVKGDCNRMIEAYREENEQVREELKVREQELVTKNHERMSAMELAVSSINRKLREGSYQYRKIQKLTNKVELAPDPYTVMKIANEFLKQELPESCEIAFALTDEYQMKFHIFGMPTEAVLEGERDLDLLGEIPEGLLLPEQQDSLFIGDAKSIHRCGVDQEGSLIFPFSRLEKLSEYVLIPLSRYHELLGFIWVASPRTGILTQTSVKYLQRLAKPVAGAIFGLNYFAKHKKQSSLVAALDAWENNASKEIRSLEETLDYYFGILMESVGVERTSLMLLDQQRKNLSVFAAKGYRVYPFSGVRIAWGEGIAGSSLKDDRIICISKMRPEMRRGVAVKSLACVPLVSKKEPLGVLNLSTLSYHKTFESSDVNAAHRIASHLTDALLEKSELSRTLRPNFK